MPFKRIPTPTQDAGNWGTILNDHLAQTQNPLNGAFNTFDQFSERPTNLTADDAGKTYLYIQTGNWHEWSGTAWEVLNSDSLNVKDYGVIGDGVVDDTVKIQAVIDMSQVDNNQPKVYFPRGKYRVTNTLNLTTPVNVANPNHAFHIEFERRSSLEYQNTILIGQTGDKPVIETTGSVGVTLDNVAIYGDSDLTITSKIGIMHCRQAFGGAFRHLYRNVTIKLQSISTANSGLGTVGLVNISAEEQMYENIDISANTCYVHSSSYIVRFTKGDYSELSTYSFVSSFSIPLANAVTSTVVTFSGLGRFESLDWFSPIVLIHTPNGDFNTASIDFGNIFMIKVFPSDGVTHGIYDYAFEIFNMKMMKHFGQMEGCGRYILLHGALKYAEHLMYDGGNTPMLNAPLPYKARGGYINIWPIVGLEPLIENSRITMFTEQPIIAFLTCINLFTNTIIPSIHEIRNCEFKINNPYQSGIITKGILKNTTNSKFSFSDRKLSIGKKSQITEIDKPIGTNSSATINLFSMELPTIVANNAGFSATCSITGSLTNARPTVSNSSTVSFTSSFSLSTQASNGAITLTPVTTVVGAGANISSGSNAITDLTYVLDTTTIPNTVAVNVKPNTTGSDNATVTLTGKIEITYSEAYEDNIVLDF